ncbi:MAG TPA: glycosyltransferase family 2 protein [Xanthobacteraceae bacterium]|nr:glycosyltransferase family 2 protein [Xanthobacteraceae bacterium]
MDIAAAREEGISVVLPNYNHGKYVERAVAAILAQDRPPCEILIVDDGSTDDSLAIINKIAITSPLVRAFRNPTNQGIVAAQSRGLALAKGRYIHLAAADDWVLPGFYSLALEMLERHPDAGLFTGDSVLLDGRTGRFLSVRPLVMPRFRPGYLAPATVRKALASSDNWILTGASIIRADAVATNGGLHEELGSFADGFLTRKIALTRGYCYEPRLVATWSIFPQSASRSVALDVEKAKAIGVIAQAHISADTVFPPWYAKRFGGRWRFSTARLALSREPIDPRSVLALGALARVDLAVLNAILGLSRGLIGRGLAAAWLFIRLRPYRVAGIAATFLYRLIFFVHWRARYTRLGAKQESR